MIDQMFKFGDSDLVYLSNECLDEDSSRKQLYAKQDIHLNAREGVYFDTKMRLDIENELYLGKYGQAVSFGESDTEEDIAIPTKYIIKGGCCYDGDTICLFIQNLTASELIIKKDTKLAEIFLECNANGYLEVVNAEREEASTTVYDYLGVVVKEKVPNTIDSIMYTEDFEKGNFINIKLKEDANE